MPYFVPQGMFKMLRSSNGSVSYRAVLKNEFNVYVLASKILMRRLSFR